VAWNAVRRSARLSGSGRWLGHIDGGCGFGLDSGCGNRQDRRSGNCDGFNRGGRRLCRSRDYLNYRCHGFGYGWGCIVRRCRCHSGWLFARGRLGFAVRWRLDHHGDRRRRHCHNGPVVNGGSACRSLGDHWIGRCAGSNGWLRRRMGDDGRRGARLRNDPARRGPSRSGGRGYRGHNRGRGPDRFLRRL
jgi:hypothetical protein